MKKTQSKKLQGELPLLTDGKTLELPPDTGYPKPFQSEWSSTGSMTIDPGQTFYITLDEDGFCARRETGLWSTDDLFDEMQYWPQTVVWTGSAARLDQLLRELAKANGLNRKQLFALVVEYYEDCLNLRITAYLAEEKKRAK